MYDFETWPERHDTTSVKWKMIETELGAGHEDVLALSVADMEFVTPPAVVEALVDAARNDVFGYDYATDEYLAAVCDWMRRRHGLEADPKLISLSAGVMPAVNTALRAFTHPGDAVIIQRPVYYPFTNAAMNNGLEILNNTLLFDGETGRYSMDFEDLERKASDPRCKAIMLCNPHNPVGRVWTAEELRMLGDICVANDVMILCDEIHGDLEHPGYAVTMFGTLGERYADHLIEFTAPSKSFNLAGLLCSNAIFHNAKVKQEFDIAAAKTGGSTVNHLGMVACMAAYARCEDWFEEMLAVVRRNLDTVRAFADAHDGIRLIEPEGTYLAWLDCRGLGLSNDELETFMHEQARLYFDEGYLFGREGSGFERINLACPVRVIERMCRQLDAALCKLGVAPVAADFADCV
ncbi:MalY/PatB family protein [Bifidobacterium animalis]|uniref:MalY/PatB family protein n=1 Tax=Bifidobacterium animalis TaxID=28025 RepID=UPI001C3EF05F|nr:MalY/PatB family protein [Bifidobacterium animalis]MCR1995454.1 pyridoxal phosphate-dependent aminotransferase [Bifidobacterium animalis subsp. animalis]